MAVDRLQRQLSEAVEQGLNPPDSPLPVKPSYYRHMHMWFGIAVVGALCCGVVGFVLGQNIGHPHKNQPAVSQNVVCVPCEDSEMEVDSKRHINRHRNHKKQTLCCYRQGGPPNPYTSFLSKDARALEQVQQGANCGRGRYDQPSAHMYLDFTKMNGSHLQWNISKPNSDGTGHISASIIYRQQYGGLEVTHPGIYNIYTKIAFRQLPIGVNSSTMFVHFLYRKPAGAAEPEIVIRSQTTKMELAGARLMQPSHLSAAIKLHLGDILYVQVSNMSAVYRSALDNFFGIYRISAGS